MSVSQFVGIDVSSLTLDVAIWNSNDRQYQQKQFENNEKDVQVLLKWFKENNLTPDNSIILCENTGVYDDLALHLLTVSNWPCVVEKTTVLQKVKPEHHAKTDKLDARLLAEYAWRFFDRLQLYVPKKTEWNELHQLHQQRLFLVQKKTASENKLTTLSRNPFASKFVINQLNQEIELLKKQISEIQKEIKKHINKNPELKQRITLLQSIPGIGIETAVMLSWLFSGQTTIDYRKAASWFGLAPHPRQSGTSLRGKPKTGHGRKEMKTLLTLGARSASTHNPVFRNYKEQKLKEGKHNRVVENNVANKLLKVACAVWNSNTPFDKNFVSKFAQNT